MSQRQLGRCALAIALAVGGVALADMTEKAPSGEMLVLKDTVASPGTVRASKLLDSEVYDPSGKDVGKIKDIVINRTYDSIGYTVVQYGTVGVNDKLLAMPYKALTFGGPTDDNVYVQAPLDVVKRAPGFDDSKWPVEANADYYRSLDSYYNTRLGPALSQSKVPDASERAQLASGMVEPASMVWSRRADKLMGRDVLSTSGEKLGSIKDLVIDIKTGDIRYAVLARRDGQPGATYYAVPLSTFRVDPIEKKMVLSLTPDELKAIPSFDKNNWPATADPRWTSPPVIKDEYRSPQIEMPR